MSTPAHGSIEHALPKVTYAASGVTAGVSAWGLQEWGIVLSMVVAVATYATTLFFKVRDDRRKQRRFETEMEERQE